MRWLRSVRREVSSTLRWLWQFRRRSPCGFRVSWRGRHLMLPESLEGVFTSHMKSWVKHGPDAPYETNPLLKELRERRVVLDGGRHYVGVDFSKYGAPVGHRDWYCRDGRGRRYD